MFILIPQYYSDYCAILTSRDKFSKTAAEEETVKCKGFVTSQNKSFVKVITKT